MKKIVFSAGDPNGIGAEIFLKAANKTESPEQLIYVGNGKILEFYSERLGIPLPPVEIVEVESDFSINPGNIETVNGKFSAECIKQAVNLIKEKKAHSLITLPICKENFRQSGFEFEGHTDYLKYLTHSPKTMMMFYSPSFSVILHTVHIPLKKVFDSVKADKLAENMEFAYIEIQKLGIKNPEFFVCGINPHAGENGYIGKEDFEIKKAVELLKNKGLNIKGVFPADTLFAKVKHSPSKVIYAMYHDQGLIGIKTAHPEESANITLGLPFLRASVSHGTAFDIAGKNKANYNNLLYVINTVLKLTEEKK